MSRYKELFSLQTKSWLNSNLILKFKFLNLFKQKGNISLKLFSEKKL